MESNLTFTQEEQKIRKQWLFWQIKISLFLLAGSVLLFIFALLINFSFELLLGVCVFTILGLAGNYLGYYCAYKNPGTAFLLLSIISLAILIGKEIFDFGILVNDRVNFEVKAWAFATTFSSLFLCYQTRLLYLCFKLRQINKNYKRKMFESSEAYIQAVSSFEQASNIKELEEKFKDLMYVTESGVAKNCISNAYKAHKKVLKTASA